MKESIPKHFRCTNCGRCCGPVVISSKEKKAIDKYISKNNIKFKMHKDPLICGFRQDSKCAIYEVRPILCRLFGVTKGMECKNGNSHNIDGFKLLNKYYVPVGVINIVYGGNNGRD